MCAEIEGLAGFDPAESFSFVNLCKQIGGNLLGRFAQQGNLIVAVEMSSNWSVLSDGVIKTATETQSLAAVPARLSVH